MNNPAIETSTDRRSANTSASSAPLLRVIGVGLLFGVVTALLATMDRVPWQRAEQPVTGTSAEAAASGLAPLPRREPEPPRAVTTSGELTPSGVAGIVDTLTRNEPPADPGGKAPKPRGGELFHRMVEGDMTLRVYTVSGSPEAVMTSFAKDLEKAGFQQEESLTNKADGRGRIHRVYSKGDVEVLVTASRGAEDQAGHTLVTIVEEPKRSEP